MKEYLRKRLHHIFIVKGYDGGTAGVLSELVWEDNQRYSDPEHQTLQWVMMMEDKYCIDLPADEFTDDEIENLITDEMVQEEYKRYIISYYHEYHSQHLEED